MTAEAWPEGTTKEKRKFLKLSMVSPELLWETTDVIGVYLY